MPVPQAAKVVPTTATASPNTAMERNRFMGPTSLSTASGETHSAAAHGLTGNQRSRAGFAGRRSQGAANWSGGPGRAGAHLLSAGGSGFPRRFRRHQLGQQLGEELGRVGAARQRQYQLVDVLLVDRLGV